MLLYPDTQLLETVFSPSYPASFGGVPAGDLPILLGSLPFYLDHWRPQ